MHNVTVTTRRICKTTHVWCPLCSNLYCENNKVMDIYDSPELEEPTTVKWLMSPTSYTFRQNCKPVLASWTFYTRSRPPNILLIAWSSLFVNSCLRRLPQPWGSWRDAGITVVLARPNPVRKHPTLFLTAKKPPPANTRIERQHSSHTFTNVFPSHLQLMSLITLILHL